MATAADRSCQALTFRVGEEELAVAVGEVAEVIRHPRVTRVPLAPASLLGVANLRGAVIPVVSLHLLLGHAQAEDRAQSSARQRVIVVGTTSPIGLMVDEVSALVAADTVGTAKNAARFIDLQAVLASDFSARPARSAAVASQLEKAEAASDTSPEQAFFSFGVAGQEYALPLAAVREVLALPAVATVPRTDAAMLGVVPLRERLLPIVSLRHLLGLAETERPRRVVVATIGKARVGLAVENVKAIVRAAPEQIDPVPPVLTRGSAEAQIQSICRLDGGRRLVSILSTDHLLEGGLAARLAAEAQDEDDDVADVKQAAGEAEQYVIFRLGEEDYGLPIGSVDEVVPLADTLAKLPKAPAFVEGVMNLRGKVVPVIDQRRRFEVPAGSAARRPRVLVVRIGQAHAGFIVDGVSEVLSIPATDLREPPQLTSEGSSVIERIANLQGDGRMILIIDPQELLDRAERDMLDSMQRTAPA